MAATYNNYEEAKREYARIAHNARQRVIDAAFTIGIEQLFYAQAGATFTGQTHTQMPPRQSPTPSWCGVLSLPVTATVIVIKTRYRELAKRHHPDRGGSPTTFNRITEAYNEALAYTKHN